MSTYRKILSSLRGVGYRYWALIAFLVLSALVVLWVMWPHSEELGQSGLPGIPGAGYPPEVKWEEIDPAYLVSFSSRTKPTDASGKPYPMVQGYLRKPPGPGPFPAVVVNHTRYIFPHHKAWVDRLAEWGYVALLVNLIPLNIKEMGIPGLPSVAERTDAAFSALDYLQRQPFVRSDKVGALGWIIFGGAAVMVALETSPEKPDQPNLPIFTLRPEQRFRAGVAYYPDCPKVPPFFSAPLLVLVGDKDRRKHHEDCKRLETQRKNPEQPLQVIVYPGATSNFDLGIEGVDGWGVKYSSDPKATADSIQRIHAFLDQHLR
ncbi:MAG: dienelactone hydrolase family protein [Deltaproteobacteria bacterium]|nr:dienelactone hydrolase family protein [Deltaproteobacteria bacterium]